MAEVPDFLTVEEAADVLRIGRTLAYQLAQESIATKGERGIPCRRVGRLLRVPSRELAQFAGGPITWPPVAPALVEVDTRMSESAALTARAISPESRAKSRTTSRRAPEQSSLPFSS